MTTIIKSLLLAFGFIFSLSIFSQGVTNISPKQAQKLINEGATMLDVRTPEEIKALSYDVKNIKTIPVNQIRERMGEVSKDETIVVVCRSGGRSARAAKELAINSYKNIYNMEGGIIAWEKAGLPLIKNGQKTIHSENDNSSNEKRCCSKKAKCCSKKHKN